MKASGEGVRDSVVLVDDDELRAGDEWKPLIEAHIRMPVRVSRSQEFQKDVGVLEERRAACREGRDPGLLHGTIFDRAAILVVDYDLFDFSRSLDGDAVAYLARCYSACGLIVGVNQDLTARWYDLTLLDHPLAFTDISIGASQLGSPSLWSRQTEKAAGIEFRPWQWPHLDDAAEDLEKCVDHAAAHHEGDVLSLLGIDETHRGLVTRDVVSVIQRRTGPDDEPAVATPDELVADSTLGRLAAKDRIPDAAVPRVVAARLRKWLDAVVLPRQDILVDAPHLVAQIPGLLRDPDDESQWQATCDLHATHEELPLAENDSLTKSRAAFGDVPWISRPTWWLRDIASSAELDAARDRAGGELGLVFCEDVSAFCARGDARRISTKVGGNRSQRWVRIPRDGDGRPFADYEPAVRLVD